ncbi:MAG: PEGA domain-containing protein [Myxococcota bacterium]|nr:PEGA domain-containing protein [Myxococcota bacterium]
MKLPFFLFILPLFSCRHRVRVVSDPVGAKIFVGERYVGISPQEITQVWWPGKSETLRLEIAGYHTINKTLVYPFFNLGEDLIFFRYDRIFGFKATQKRFYMIKEDDKR